MRKEALDQRHGAKPLIFVELKGIAAFFVDMRFECAPKLVLLFAFARADEAGQFLPVAHQHAMVAAFDRGAMRAPILALIEPNVVIALAGIWTDDPSCFPEPGDLSIPDALGAVTLARNGCDKALPDALGEAVPRSFDG